MAKSFNKHNEFEKNAHIHNQFFSLFYIKQSLLEKVTMERWRVGKAFLVLRKYGKNSLLNLLLIN